MHIGFWWESQKQRLLGRPRSRCIKSKINLGETGFCGMDWIDLAQDRYNWRALVNTVMNLRGSIKCL
jgi:hypothetical protein